jgi:hypothetical protein
MAPEVLFGTLHQFGVAFADEVCRVFRDAQPNAVHAVAADVLNQGGCVWTPNIDLAVEAACVNLGFKPHRTGRPANDPDSPLYPLGDTHAGSYVKFHGTAEAASTLAFTDRQLIAPLPKRTVDALVGLAQGRVVVFYGYAGADADLADLIERVISRAKEVHWFEPSRSSSQLIQQAFPNARARIGFVPDWTSVATDKSVGDMAAAFLALARAHGHQPDSDLERQLINGGAFPPDPVLTLASPSGATQARLVERFSAGGPTEENAAWSMAWRDDLRHRRYGAFRGHLRHGITYSLYHAGVVAGLVGWLAEHRIVLGGLRPRRVRDYFITRACALLLRGRDWRKLREFTDWAVDYRSGADGAANPSDLYYQAQAYRYSLQPAQARTSADRAIAGLQDVADAERLAGALYEAGEAAIYQADFTAALGYAFQLRYRRGRYAIPRWQAWGAWLETVALAHLGELDRTDEPIEAMTKRFQLEKDTLNIADVRTAELLVARVRLAQTGSLGLESLDAETDSVRTRRYKDDLDLLRADIAIALDDRVEAQCRLTRVREEGATPISTTLAQLGLAELHRLNNPRDTNAADPFETLANEAHQKRATWIEAQAALGVHLCDESRAAPLWRRLEKSWPQNGGVPLQQLTSITNDPPRVLWLLTI